MTSRYVQPRYRAQQLLAACTRRAGKRGLPVTITAALIEEAILAGECQLTGLPFILETDCKWQSHPMAPSVDRIDSNKGYTPDNVQIVCVGINQLKSQYPFHIVRVLAKAYLKATAGVTT